ncbi:MAG: FAD-dependent oxidoreductase [Desulfobulbaceae bacterium]|nr:FAD-dependent oxidoreductase [Desulfobulbaceae bacterium]
MNIKGNNNGKRISSRILEETIQTAIKDGAKELTIEAQGQHGIGGRIWPKYGPVKITASGPIGQRLGAMGMPGTEIIADGGASDDVGWLNCGATITVLGDVTNGAHNAGAQGVLYIQGGGGARCETMTKQNPRFEPLQSWYFRDVGDSFAEFKAGGIAVVCGVNPRHPENILGYRPCVGMVGGTIYFRGPIKGYSDKDVQLLDLTEQDWQWLTENMKTYLEAIRRTDHLDELTKSMGDWQKLVAYTPAEKKSQAGKRMSAREFRRNHWEKEVGKGGIFADMVEETFTLAPYIATGKNRLQKPLWLNEEKLAPCVAACPAGIPSHKRYQLLRDGKENEALQLVLKYSPLPASVCGELCPNLCMKACTRKLLDKPLDIKGLGKLSGEVTPPKPSPATGQKVAVVGGGPAGLAAAWQLSLLGHEVTIYEAKEHLGGKLLDAVSKGKLESSILDRDIKRIASSLTCKTGVTVDSKLLTTLCKDNDGVIIACGAQDKDGQGLSFLTTGINHADGKIKVNEMGQTHELKVFAVGDVVSRGLATHAIGSGRKGADALSCLMMGQDYTVEKRETITSEQLNLVYYEAGQSPDSLAGEAQRCVSCGLCRDCHLCESACYHKAISRQETTNGEFEYIVDEQKCIGCGFCAGICPCGVWIMQDNV